MLIRRQRLDGKFKPSLFWRVSHVLGLADGRLGWRFLHFPLRRLNGVDRVVGGHDTTMLCSDKSPKVMVAGGEV